MGLLDGVFRDTKVALQTQINDLREEIASLKAERAARAREGELHAESLRLKGEIEDLRISADRIKEDNAREKREVLHKVGLERKRQAFEEEQARKGIESARQEAVLEVRETNLEDERKRFEDQMEFREKRFTEEVGYLKDLMGQVLERLPSVIVDRQISEKTSTTRAGSTRR